ncbi:MAG: hypothetical protein HOI59_13520 [Nitrospina sp.]|jgi:hypothetical protein|nr:hypothetical protein [Nitrospina sp.]MBT3415984.1 hypothetical protein [Nitrospina sp.]MBT3856342.1 hypothetical protein [Nitrospina sp.]MBT4104946.1 hypothetical protein [Nitrospina sp.]MBT4390957.1 hypothetical protein [Nitrospina sp.]
MTTDNHQTDAFFAEYIERFLSGNKAGRCLNDDLSDSGVGLMPLIDHCAIRTLDVNSRVEDLLCLGFSQDQTLGTLEFDSWWAKVYRKPGYPSLFVDQAFEGKRGEPSLIPGWVQAHGDQCFHHIAVLVEDIEYAIGRMKARDIEFAGQIVGAPNTDLRQIFTRPEIKDAYTVLELIERHNGYQGFLPPQADGLMESSRL